jgi:Kef-type K+ transport system membrane component KefB
LTFALGIAACVAVTALPMLAIVVGDLGLFGTSLGRAALAAAVFDDFGLWVMLAVIGAAARGSATASGVATTIALALVLAAAMLTVVRALLRRLAAGAEGSDAAALTWSFGALTMSGAVADLIGVHFAIGALLAGLSLPRPLFLRAVRVFEPLCLFVMLPFFFLSVSLKVQPISDSISFWATLGTLISVSIIAKFVAAAMPSYLLGASLRESCAVGALVQSKGLMEVVALNVLLDAGIISGECLPPFLALAIVTTVLSKPLARLFLRPSVRALPYDSKLPAANNALIP